MRNDLCQSLSASFNDTLLNTKKRLVKNNYNKEITNSALYHVLENED